MRNNNWKWIVLLVVVVLIITILVWKSQQRIKELDKQLDNSATNHK